MTDPQSIFLLAIFIFAIASLYASVGHGGGSGYLAALALFGVAPEELRPIALSLNVLVTLIGSYKYISHGWFNPRLFWLFALVSTPFAFLGGMFDLPAPFFKGIIGLVLIFAAYQLFAQRKQEEYAPHPPNLFILAGAGVLLGILAGMVGVGGGIFLSPLLIGLKWERVTKVSGIASAFILVNSIAGLIGFYSTHPMTIPDGLPLWAAAAIMGGVIGSDYARKRLGAHKIQVALSLVLSVAGLKMFANMLV